MIHRQIVEPATPCAACGRPTREGKPFCPDHVEELPYVASLMCELAAQAAEHQAVSKNGAGAVNVDGTTARELLHLLQLHGPRTVQRLGRELNIKPGLVSDYARALAAAGRVILGRSRRGKVLLQVPPPARRQGEGDKNQAA